MQYTPWRWAWRRMNPGPNYSREIITCARLIFSFCDLTHNSSFMYINKCLYLLYCICLSMRLLYHYQRHLHVWLNCSSMHSCLYFSTVLRNQIYVFLQVLSTRQGPQFSCVLWQTLQAICEEWIHVWRCWLCTE